MKCQYCQTDQDYTLCKYHSCHFCYKWIFLSRSEPFGKVYENGNIICLWYDILDENIRIYFHYDMQKTVIRKTLTGIYIGGENLLRLNYVMPITPKTLQDIPKKLKLYQVFS